MLKLLYIHNFALAERLEIEFYPGLNILTGETGAGKSILVGAIAAVLGERVYTEVIRSGEDKATVEATFSIADHPEVSQFLEQKGLPGGDELLVRREISLKSNSRAFINDTPVTVTTLAQLGDLLMDIHGQHEHQSLLKKETHRRFIDEYGQLQELLEGAARQYRLVREKEKIIRDLEGKQRQLEEQRELYEFQFKEIQKAALQPGEEEALEQERRLLNNTEKLFALSARLTELFNDADPSLLTMMGEADHELRELGQFTEALQKLYEEFTGARIVLEETARSVEEFRNQLEFEPQRLEEVEGRLNQISQLKKKYGATVAEILTYRDELEKNLQLQENFKAELEKLNHEYETARQAFQNTAEELSQQRQKVARKLEKRVEAQLSTLGMPAMRFQVQFQRVPDPNGLFIENAERFYADEHGVDQIEFFISPNPGEDFKPLTKIASGGEISRIMLALKSILAHIDHIPALVFDEIDSGVSGRIAQAVGRSIRELSKNHQILCITHLPQIASYGHHHYLVEKRVENERTFTRIRRLDDREQVEAIARLIGGEHLSDTVLDSARQLIRESLREESG